MGVGEKAVGHFRVDSDTRTWNVDDPVHEAFRSGRLLGGATETRKEVVYQGGSFGQFRGSLRELLGQTVTGG